jgi:hypothetical protein
VSISQKNTIHYFSTQPTVHIYLHINLGQTTPCAQVR